MGAPWTSASTPSTRLFLLSILGITVVLIAPANANTELELSNINISSWRYNATYYSSTKYDARGMGPLYNLTHAIIRLFVGDKPIPPDYVIITEQGFAKGPNWVDQKWGDLLKAYWGVLLIIVLTALLVVLMPIIGLCFCCCRCAGACGGRSQPFDKKHDTCRRAFLGLLLICAATGILFGVVVAFVTNSYMQEGLEETTEAAISGSNDTKLFLETTSLEMNHLLVTNYKELTESLESLVRDEATSILKDLEMHFNADSFTYLSDFAHKLPEIEKNLKKMKTITNELRVNAAQLNDGLRGVKRELLVTLTKCQTEECRKILKEYEIGKLDANGIDYNQLPDVSKTIQDVSDLLNKDNVVDSISKGKQKIDDMRRKLNDSIDVSISSVSEAMKKAGKATQSASLEMKNAFNNIANVIANYTEKGTNQANYYIDNYSIYRFYVGLAISSILLLILVCLVISLFCGVCGKRPEGYGDDCCNKGAGSRFLMLAITLMFLTISVLAVVALMYFLVGMVLHRGVCLPLRDPENDQIFNYIDNIVDLNKVLYQNKKKSFNKLPEPRDFAGTKPPPFRISHVIVECKKNLSVYEVLRLHNFIDISEVRHYLENFKINETIYNLVDEIESKSKIKIIDDTVKQQIGKLAESELTKFQSGRFVDNLKENITRYSLKEIADYLLNTADRIQGHELNELIRTLKNQALHLETYQIKLVTPMTEQTNELSELAQELEQNLQYKGNAFDDSMNKLLDEIQEAQDFIDGKRTEFVKESAGKLIKPFLGKVEQYLDLVVDSVQTEVGKCAPLANVYDSLIVAGCNKFVDPFNGFWAGVGWCVILFLPTLIISIKLSSLYQKSDPYPGPLVESEYLYDAYSERDNIPLANGPKNKRRKAKDRRRGSRDRRGDYYEDSGSSHGTAAGRDPRYSDMAPRHWDGGPPRYQNPPMAPPASEYERPPPYYYPGAPSEQE